MTINKNFLKLEDSYLFSTVNRKSSEFQKKNPDASIIRLSIGDVTLPLCPAVIAAMRKAVTEMSEAKSFRGYGPEQGYDFLKTAIQGYYAKRSVSLSLEDIFISDGAKSDLGNILDIFSIENTALIPDPVYPVYVDTNIMGNRKINFLDANEANGFLPLPDQSCSGDLIYLCSPNNPTGAVYNRAQLKEWVDFALKTGAVILFDAAYESFIDDPALPRSIYEIEGAKACAIEFCSLSKTAGFTGTRCGYTIVPKELQFDGASLQKLWLRRQTTKFNGVPYLIQRGAAAVFSDEGQQQTQQALSYYKENAKNIASALSDMGIWFTGGKCSPYIWLKCPNGQSSWDYFDYLLQNANVVGTPGSGFGKNGEGFFRLTAFGDREKTKEAIERIRAL